MLGISKFATLPEPNLSINSSTLFSKPSQLNNQSSRSPQSQAHIQNAVGCYQCHYWEAALVYLLPRFSGQFHSILSAVLCGSPAQMKYYLLRGVAFAHSAKVQAWCCCLLEGFTRQPPTPFNRPSQKFNFNINFSIINRILYFFDF
jgi:hypothetical protein